MFAVSVCCPRELIVVGRSTRGWLCGTTCHCNLFPMNVKLLSKTAKVCLSSSLLEEETVNYRSNCSDCVNVHATKAVITTVIMSIRTINCAGERTMKREEYRKRNGRTEGAMQEDGDKFMSAEDAAKMPKRSQHDTTHDSREYPHPDPIRSMNLSKASVTDKTANNQFCPPPTPPCPCPCARKPDVSVCLLKPSCFHITLLNAH